MQPVPVPPVEPIYKTTSHTFHLIMTLISFGVWAMLVWWWWAALQNRANNKKRKKYQRERATYEAARWHWEQAQRRAS